MIRSAVLIQYARVKDGIGVAYTAFSIASRGKNVYLRQLGLQQIGLSVVTCSLTFYYYLIFYV